MTSIWCDPGITKPPEFLENWLWTIFLLDPSHIKAVNVESEGCGANLCPIVSVTGKAERRPSLSYACPPALCLLPSNPAACLRSMSAVSRLEILTDWNGILETSVSLGNGVLDSLLVGWIDMFVRLTVLEWGKGHFQGLLQDIIFLGSHEKVCSFRSLGLPCSLTEFTEMILPERAWIILGGQERGVLCGVWVQKLVLLLIVGSCGIGISKQGS